MRSTADGREVDGRLMLEHLERGSDEPRHDAQAGSLILGGQTRR